MRFPPATRLNLVDAKRPRRTSLLARWSATSSSSIIASSSLPAFTLFSRQINETRGNPRRSKGVLRSHPVWPDCLLLSRAVEKVLEVVAWDTPGLPILYRGDLSRGDPPADGEHGDAKTIGGLTDRASRREISHGTITGCRQSPRTANMEGFVVPAPHAPPNRELGDTQAPSSLLDGLHQARDRRAIPALRNLGTRRPVLHRVVPGGISDAGGISGTSVGCSANPVLSITARRPAMSNGLVR